MQALLDVIIPVFLVVGFGYVAVWRQWFPMSGVEGLMKFATNFAVPTLLFTAIVRLDLEASLNPPLIVSFYAGATAGFAVGFLGARYLFGRSSEDSVAIGFACLFSNTVLLGLPISERAFGVDALAANFAIIAFHAPFCYGIGVTVMEVVRGKGTSWTEASKRVLNAMFHNALIIGIVLGFLVNISGVPIPGVVDDALNLLVTAAIPAALFGLGGVLSHYKIEGDLRVIGLVCGVSLVLHPAIVWALGRSFELSDAEFRSAVITAAMAPGVNAYLFAAIYQTAMRVAASAVLIATALSVLTAWVWLTLLT